MIATQALQERMWRWLDARRPAAKYHILNRNNLFIFPSWQGLWFLVADVILWLVGTNYENNLVLALAFLLITLFIVSILHTFANLSGLGIQLLSVNPVFSGESAEVKLLISRHGKRVRDNIRFYWFGNLPTVVSLIDEDELQIAVMVKTSGRGWFNPGRIFLESTYPLGIIRCWTRLDLDCQILVYPKPIPAGPLPKAQALRDDGDTSSHRGADEFNGYKTYQAGDSMRNVAWKQYARGLNVMSKEFSAYVDHRLWLDWDYLGGMEREGRLSRLCYWVLECGKTEQEFGLRLPNEEMAPGSGPAQQLQALKMLALFESQFANATLGKTNIRQHKNKKARIRK